MVKEELNVFSVVNAIREAISDNIAGLEMLLLDKRAGKKTLPILEWMQKIQLVSLANNRGSMGWLLLL